MPYFTHILQSHFEKTNKIIDNINADIISNTICCLTNNVDNIINTAQIEVVILNIFDKFLLLIVTYINIKDIIQCILGKQLTFGVSKKYIKFTILSVKELVVTTFLIIVVGYKKYIIDAQHIE